MDELLKNKKHKDSLESFEIRKANLEQLVKLINQNISCDIVPLRDMFGPSGDRPELQAIVVSKETEKGGALVNAKRAENGKPI